MKSKERMYLEKGIKVYLLFTITISSLQLSSQTYSTIQNGDWHQPSTWLNGIVPDISDDIIQYGEVVNIYHEVYIPRPGKGIPTTSDLKNFGILNIEENNLTFNRAILKFDDGINFTNEATGSLSISDALFYQCRFSSCQDEDYDNLGGVTKQSGLWFNKGEVKCINSYIEVPESWLTDGGTRSFVNCCIITGGNYQINNSTDTYSDINISSGWQKRGSFQIYDSDVTFKGTSIQLVGESGKFEFQSGNVTGDVPPISFRNHLLDTYGRRKYTTKVTTSNVLSIGQLANKGELFASVTNDLSVGLDNGMMHNTSFANNRNFNMKATEETKSVKINYDEDLLNSSLPVATISLEAFVTTDGLVELQWSSPSKTDDYFEILKSENSEKFVPIGYEQSAGYSYDMRQYSFIDHNPIEGINYYQIKQIDFDDVERFSIIAKVEVKSEEISFNIFPNPDKGIVDLKISGNTDGNEFILLIKDSNGKLIKSATLEHTLRIHTTDLPSGLSYAQILNPESNRSINKRMIISK